MKTIYFYANCQRMIKYFAHKNDEIDKWLFFDEPREAMEYIKQKSIEHKITIQNFTITSVEIPE